MSSSSSEVGLGKSASGSSNKDQNDESNLTEVTSSEAVHKPQKKWLGRVWNALSLVGSLFYRSHNEDFGKKLEHLSKEEAAIHARLKRRSQSWRNFARGMIIYSIIIEIFLLGVAIVMTRPPDISWQARAIRVFPMFAFPTLASLVYSACGSIYRMCERKDQKVLDRLREERKAKIDELKERTNYYLTQQLIHKYDSDPAAKEAAARVLASKLGADAGLAFKLEPLNMTDENMHANPGKNHKIESLDKTGLRRRTSLQRTSSSEQSLLPPGQERNGIERMGNADSSDQYTEIELFPGKMSNASGGWVARLAAMLVGEDPTQCYALICKNCHMHNGLARKEDFQYITYHCPHCHTLNGSNQLGEADITSSLAMTPRVSGVQSRIPLLNAQLDMSGASVELQSSESYTTASEGSELSG